jgi:hypothetical protein
LFLALLLSNFSQPLNTADVDQDLVGLARMKKNMTLRFKKLLCLIQALLNKLVCCCCKYKFKFVDPAQNIDESTDSDDDEALTQSKHK